MGTCLALIACGDDPTNDDICFVNCGGNDGVSVQVLSPGSVSKTNNVPVYMHYMPWFEAKDGINDRWGIHWTMNASFPDVIGNDGQRDIASHYYPLIGPYSTNDPLVIDYHLLLMKYAGIDGILINWYGVEGSNGDINSLLEHSETIIGRTDEVGLGFSVVMEDRFSRNVNEVIANISYVNDNYYRSDQFIHIGSNPLLMIFGPITIQDPVQWTTILGSTSASEIFLPLWGFTGKTGASNVSGEYSWVVSSGMSGLSNYYQNVNASKVIGGAAYPGFKDYYEEGGWTSSALPWSIEVGAATLKSTLDLAKTNASKIDFLQLVTWNDYGEGTMIEPTEEFGFSFLQEVQSFTGVAFGLEELEMIHELYLKRRQYEGSGESDVIKKLDQVYYYLVALKVEDARALLDSVE